MVSFSRKDLVKNKSAQFRGILQLGVHCVTVESGLGQKYAFITKSTILSQSLRNIDKMSTTFSRNLVMIG